MAKFTNGLLNSISGSIGPIVGSSWNGIAYIRAKPARRTSEPSLKQEMHYAKLRLINKFTYNMQSLFDASFCEHGRGKTGANCALSHNIKNAVAGNYPDFFIDYSMVLISQGALPNAALVSATGGDRCVQFNWKDNSGIGIAKPTDQCIAVVFNPKNYEFSFTLNGNTRNSCAHVFNAEHFKGETVETWLGFISADSKEIANSIYTGQVTVL